MLAEIFLSLCDCPHKSDNALYQKLHILSISPFFKFRLKISFSIFISFASSEIIVKTFFLPDFDPCSIVAISPNRIESLLSLSIIDEVGSSAIIQLSFKSIRLMENGRSCDSMSLDVIFSSEAASEKDDFSGSCLFAGKRDTSMNTCRIKDHMIFEVDYFGDMVF